MKVIKRRVGAATLFVAMTLLLIHGTGDARVRVYMPSVTFVPIPPPPHGIPGFGVRVGNLTSTACAFGDEPCTDAFKNRGTGKLLEVMHCAIVTI